MPEIHGKPEIPEMNPHEVKGFQEIKPKTDITISEAKDFVKNLFSEIQSSFEKHYVPYEERFKRTPVNDVQWDGERAESKCKPDGQTPESRAAQDKLAEFRLDGIEYRNAEPDFSKVSEETVKIENMSENCFNYYDTDGNFHLGNFTQADAKCAERWNSSQKDGRTDWKPEDVRDWRRENHYSWHERCDTKTMDLIPREIHDFFRHSGGRAECKARDNMNHNTAKKGDIFDE